MKKHLLYFLVFALLQTPLFAQWQFNQPEVVSRLKYDLGVLAHDSLLGREAGSLGEIKARDFLVKQFRKIGLQSIYDDGKMVQEFSFKDQLQYGENNSLIINKSSAELGTDYWPLAISTSGQVSGRALFVSYGIQAPDKGIDDYKDLTDTEGKIFILELSVEGGIKNYNNLAEQANIIQKIKNAEKYGAKAVVIVNSDPDFPNPSKNLNTREIPSDLPIVFLQGKLAKKIKKSKSVQINVELVRDEKTAYNVIGIIDNKAPKTIVIGAHYDHLGMGGPSSRHTGEPEIHNGADDNASGVAGVIEMARRMKMYSNPEYNYLFIAFSAEEKGLIGSTHFAQGNDYDLKKIQCMLNFDMLGRLEDNSFSLNGTGTSKHWDSLISVANANRFNIKKGKSGVGGSDQMPFYLQDIPVLFFFTGLHQDYHKPSDDIEKINFEGEADLLEFVFILVKQIEMKGDLGFQKTENGMANRRSPMRKGPTLRIMPDHIYDGKGLRIGGVIQDGPADKAGLEKGDIIILIHQTEVKDIMDYMKGLSKLHKGMKVKVKVMRGEEIIETDVQL